MGASQADKAATHERILDVAAATIRRQGIDGLAVAELMNEAGLTHGGFYRHFDSRDHLVAEATQHALAKGSEWTLAAGRIGGERAYRKLINAYLGVPHRDHPESGCGVAALATDVARTSGATRASYTKQVQECLDILDDLVEGDEEETRRQTALTLSALVGAISVARALGDTDLSQQILSDVAAALKRTYRRPTGEETDAR